MTYRDKILKTNEYDRLIDLNKEFKYGYYYCIKEFLTELTKLTDKYGFKIGGCGCCGSPWVTSDGRDGGVNLEYDKEKGCYSLDAHDRHDNHEPIYIYGNMEEKDNE